MIPGQRSNPNVCVRCLLAWKIIGESEREGEWLTIRLTPADCVHETPAEAVERGLADRRRDDWIRRDLGE